MGLFPSGATCQTICAVLADQMVDEVWSDFTHWNGTWTGRLTFNLVCTNSKLTLVSFRLASIPDRPEEGA